MCLYTNTNVPKTATEDIKCFKIVRYSNGQLQGVYQYDYVYKINTLLKAEGKKGIEVSSFINPNYVKVTSGFFHSFKTLNLAKWDRYRFVSDIYSNLRIYECIIPKGSSYFENDNEYCSDQLILLKDQS